MVQSTLWRKASLIAPPLLLLHLGSTTPSGGGDRLHPPQIWCSLVELQCTGLYGAGYHQGCCLWGVGSSYTDTTRADIREQRGTGEKTERGPETSQKRGERPHLKWNIIRVRRKGGGWRKKEEDNGEMSRMVRFPLFLLPLIHFPRVFFLFLSSAFKFLVALSACVTAGLIFNLYLTFL